MISLLFVPSKINWFWRRSRLFRKWVFLTVLDESFFDICKIDGIFAAERICGLKWFFRLSKVTLKSFWNRLILDFIEDAFIQIVVLTLKAQRRFDIHPIARCVFVYHFNLIMKMYTYQWPKRFNMNYSSLETKEDI
mgnify:CR=1 FL=1